MKSSAELLGSILTIDLGGSGQESDITSCFEMTNSFEKKYSRFIEGNFLSKLNMNKNSEIDSEFFSILKLCLKLSDLTQGYFDITIQPLLENTGYGIAGEKLPENIGYKNIELSQNNVTLKNNVSIEIGSVGKGYMIDKIYSYLDKKYESFVIDFGGDIKIKGSKNIALENPDNNQNIFGNILIHNKSIASSSGNRRKIGNSHHLINPKEKKSQFATKAVFVTHKLAIFSDIFSTALFVCPKDMALKILNSVDGLEGMILYENGEVLKTRKFLINK